MEKKSKLLHVTSILMIIFGSVALLMAILALITALGNMAGVVAVELGGLSAGVILGAAIFALIGSVIQFVAGIVGVKNSSKPEKANLCVIFGVLVALLAAGDIIISIVSGQAAIGMLLLTIVLSVCIPVLYLVGALNLKKLANT